VRHRFFQYSPPLSPLSSLRINRLLPSFFNWRGDDAQPFYYIHATALDPTKLNKPRQFSRSTAPAKVIDNTLWTETPAERQQRLADEVMGRKRRVENADPEQGDADAKDDATKRRKRDAELQRQVDEHTVRLARSPSDVWMGSIFVFVFFC